MTVSKVTIDEYFEKFRAAGLKVGVCVRPQQIAMVDGRPTHWNAENEHAAQILRERIAYAKQRWGCTLFYVDSTATAFTWLDPDVFKAVADAYPDVLLMPENESMRYFAYSAPFNSYAHHKITSTPVGARLVYPKAYIDACHGGRELWIVGRQQAPVFLLEHASRAGQPIVRS